MTMTHGKLCSSTERRACHQPSAPSVAKARRCLFGPVDHVEARRILDDGMAEIADRHRRQWSFDFERECPISPQPGDRYAWQLVRDPGLGRRRRCPAPSGSAVLELTPEPIETTTMDVDELSPSQTVSLTHGVPDGFDCQLAEAARRCLSAGEHSSRRRVNGRKTTIPGTLFNTYRYRYIYIDIDRQFLLEISNRKSNWKLVLQ